jgi:molybdopterin-guanine dinucleotide biosynthesis protein A
MNTEDVAAPRTDVAALLLTGGLSRRMGRDKTQLMAEGHTLAQRTGQILSRVVATAFEVGPGTSRLPAIHETTFGQGPLVAIVAGRRALLDCAYRGDALVVASDLPFITDGLLRYLADVETTFSVVPVVEGRPQPLCARWSGRDLDAAARWVSGGERSLRRLLDEPDVTWLDESHWGHVASAHAFDDVDTPEDQERLGLNF